MMNLHNQNQHCHAERSEESRFLSHEILRCAQHDNAELAIKFYHAAIRCKPTKIG